MRITGGQFRGRRLNTPQGKDIRPTTDKVRQAMINMLHSRGAVGGSVVFDGFCGTGALGLEALSHGAESCLFFDKDSKSLALAKENAALIGAESNCAFRRWDSSKMPARKESDPVFDLVFLDPPYNQNLLAPCLASLGSGGWLSEDVVFVLEAEKGYDFDALDLSVDKIAHYGEIWVAICRT